MIKIPSPQPFEETYKSVGQRLEEESNIYSPLGRNQVEHYNSRNDDTIDEIEKYRKALDNSNNSRKSKRKMYLELIRKFEKEEQKHKKRRSKSKSQKSIKSPFSMSKRDSRSRSRSRSNNIINIKAKGGSILKSSRSGTFSKATFGGQSLNSPKERKKSIELHETLTFPILSGAQSTLDPNQVKEIYG